MARATWENGGKGTSYSVFPFVTANSVSSEGQGWLNYAFVFGAEFTASLNDLQSTGI